MFTVYRLFRKTSLENETWQLLPWFLILTSLRYVWRKTATRKPDGCKPFSWQTTRVHSRLCNSLTSLISSCKTWIKLSCPLMWSSIILKEYCIIFITNQFIDCPVIRNCENPFYAACGDFLIDPLCATWNKMLIDLLFLSTTLHHLFSFELTSCEHCMAYLYYLL